MRRLYGPKAGIARVRSGSDTYWTTQITIYSPGCRDTYTVIGSGVNTWESAFATVSPSVVVGPLSGTVTIQNAAWDNVGLVTYQWKIDNSNLGSTIVYSPAQTSASISTSWNTTSASNAIHVVCAISADAAGNIGRSRATLVQVDQAQSTVASTLDFNTADGIPSLSGS